MSPSFMVLCHLLADDSKFTCAVWTSSMIPDLYMYAFWMPTVWCLLGIPVEQNPWFLGFHHHSLPILNNWPSQTCSCSGETPQSHLEHLSLAFHMHSSGRSCWLDHHRMYHWSNIYAVASHHPLPLGSLLFPPNASLLSSPIASWIRFLLLHNKLLHG